jgi:hypothetical protein
VKPTVRTNLQDVVRDLNGVAKKQAPFAISKALNKTARDFQKEEKEQLTGSFSLRRRTWAQRHVKIGQGDNATKRNLEAKVRFVAPGDPARTDVLAKFEEGGVKRPVSGSRIAVPREKARIKGLQQERLKVFDFQPHGASGRVLKGLHRTLMIKEPGGRGVILQRHGRGRGTLRILFSFHSSVKIEPKLKFRETAERIGKKQVVKNFEEALEHAIRTAR